MPDSNNIRRAAPSDLAAIRRLFSQRDERAWTEDQVAWSLHGLDPGRCLAWLAFVDGAPVGLTSVYLRDLMVAQTRVRAAYWANLYIDPGHRDRMLYPRLPMAMFTALRQAGVPLLYAAVRRQDVAEAHTAIGFQRLGDFSLLLKPLRPARLLARHRGLRSAVPLARPLDAAFSLVRAALRPRAPARIAAVELSEPSPLLLDASSATIRHLWTPDELAHRYSQTREGTGHEHLEIRDGDAPVGALSWRIAERSGDAPSLPIRVGVLLDLAVPAERPDLLRPALAAFERRAHAAGCDALLALDGLGPAVRHQLRRAGFLATRERYTLVLWPKAALTATPALAEFTAWRLALADHDAF
ncbi:MAG: hypothetical protein JNL82_42135 [Myxococcales bacterium]|nr:hypothetical protein [Myxococcales bacterium]